MFVAFADNEKKNIVEVFNNLGGFISAGGALAAILTVITMVQHRREDRIQSIVKHANYVLFMLDRQIRYISMFGKEYLKPHENRSDNVRAYMVPAATFDPTLVDAIKIEESMFLLTVKRPELISLLDETQRDFRSISLQVEQRNHLYLSKYQAVLQQQNVTIGSDVDVDGVNSLVGEYVANELVHLTKQLYEMLPLIQQRLLATQSKLYELLKSEFPDQEFLLPVPVSKVA